MTEHFSSDDIQAWEGTVQGDAAAAGETPPDAVSEPPSDGAPEGVPDDLAAKAGEWAGTQQGNPEGAADAEAPDG